MSAHRLPHLLLLLTWFVTLGATLLGCTSQPTPVPRLRIANDSTYTVRNLIVIFPQDRVEFGDVAAGTASEYKDVPHGIFRYAAYEFEIEGKVLSQPVIDWVGEQALEGGAFTYRIEVDPNRAGQMEIIRLVGVSHDD